MAFISMLFAFGMIFFIVFLVMLAVGTVCVVFSALLGIQYRESGCTVAANGGTGRKRWKLVLSILCGAVAAVLLGSLFWMNFSAMISVILAL